jgi:uncharacterized protein (TIGR00730 family)
MQRICVYCGSSTGAGSAYAAAAERLGSVLVGRGLGLVYGGAHVGTMGVIGDTVMAAGGEAVGVIPESLRDKEIAHSGLTELHVVGSMHERKLMMMDLADGFVVLPGGTGTLEELFETFTWLQLGLHGKPIGLLDVDGYWSGLVEFLDHAVAQGFIARENADLLLVDDDPERLLDRFEAWQPPVRSKWIDRAEA